MESMSYIRQHVLGLALATGAATLALVAGPLASPAAANYSTLVVPGKSIGGIKLGVTRAKVRAYRPLNLKKPTISRRRSDVYITQAGVTLLVIYRRRHKSKPFRVLAVSSGAGSTWTTESGLYYGASPQRASELLPACVFYQHDGGGRRYDPDPGDGQFCEVQYQNPKRFFYLTFNQGGISSDVPAQLAGFTLSKVFIK
jgi:hypothetical protein